MYFTQAIAVAVLAYTATAAPAGPTCVSRDSICRKYTSNNGLSQVECDVSIAQCINACQVPFTACQNAPDANHSVCASQLVACTGTSYEDAIKPQSAVGEAVTHVAAVTSANADPVYQGNCEQLSDVCQTLPGANASKCASDKAQCKDTCSKANNACRGGPNTSMATCSAEYAACLGVNPYV